MKVGANLVSSKQGVFKVWAPFRTIVQVLFPDRPVSNQLFEMTKDEMGYWTSLPLDIQVGEAYLYVLDKELQRPDPASRLQKDTVHGPSVIVDESRLKSLSEVLNTNRPWKNRPFEEYIIYELHIGSFTPEGTLESAITRLDHLLDLGINAVELLPLAQFPGGRNWGYDGVLPYAVQNTYGGPEALARFVKACHDKDIAVIGDVVYNHFGPEGNYLSQFGPYFSEKYQTPWGGAVNYDGEHSDPVREYVINNALFWFEVFGFDALRMDAIHAIYDYGANHLLKEMEQRVEELSRQKGSPHYLIAESALNDKKILESREKGGYQLRAQWLDDYHHCLHVVLTGEVTGYYADYKGLESLTKTLSDGYVLQWQYSPFFKRHYGGDAVGVSPSSFVVFSQNHDMVGNRMLGDRLCHNLKEGPLKMAAALVILSPYVPFLFMGEEFASSSPFPYFVSHGDQNLNRLVEAGRKEEFAYFLDQGEPPTPHKESTFLSAKLNWSEVQESFHKVMLEWYKKLIQLRKAERVFTKCRYRKAQLLRDQFLHLRLQDEGVGSLDLYFNLSDEMTSEELNSQNWTFQPWSTIVFNTQKVVFSEGVTTQ